MTIIIKIISIDFLLFLVITIFPYHIFSLKGKLQNKTFCTYVHKKSGTPLLQFRFQGSSIAFQSRTSNTKPTPYVEV